MAVSLSMRIPELSIDRYDRLMVGLELDANPPVGSILHIATESVGGINISEVWQTAESAESFVEQRLRDALKEVGVTDALSYRIEPLHNMFAPNMDMIERIGAVSLPASAALRLSPRRALLPGCRPYTSRPCSTRSPNGSRRRWGISAAPSGRTRTPSTRRCARFASRLLEADVNFQVVKDFVAGVKEEALGEDILKGLDAGQQVVKLVHDRLTALMGSGDSQLAFGRPRP